MNRRRKGIRLERRFDEQLRACFPRCVTEFKPQLTFLPKDFWGLFDGLSFFPHCRRYLFWQMKTNKLSQRERKAFWKAAQPFHTPMTKVLLIEKCQPEKFKRTKDKKAKNGREKHDKDFWISIEATEAVLVKNTELKKFFTTLLRA